MRRMRWRLPILICVSWSSPSKSRGFDRRTWAPSGQRKPWGSSAPKVKSLSGVRPGRPSGLRTSEVPSGQRPTIFAAIQRGVISGSFLSSAAATAVFLEPVDMLLELPHDEERSVPAEIAQAGIFRA